MRRAPSVGGCARAVEGRDRDLAVGRAASGESRRGRFEVEAREGEGGGAIADGHRRRAARGKWEPDGRGRRGRIEDVETSSAGPFGKLLCLERRFLVVARCGETVVGRHEGRLAGPSDVDLEFVGSEGRRLDASGNPDGDHVDGLGAGPKPTIGDGGGGGDRHGAGSLPKGTEVLDEFELLDSELVVEEVEKLLLHEVDLGEGEEPGVFLPVHVFGRRVVEVFRGADEHGEEDSVTGASETWRGVSETLKGGGETYQWRQWAASP